MIKELLINTFVGRLGYRLRETLHLHHAVHRKREALGCLSNDAIAQQLLARLCLEDKIFIDVGCHIGSVVARVSRTHRPGRILAIEPIPEKVASLRRRFPDVEIHGCAVSDHEGEAEFTIDLKRSGYSSLDPARKGRHAATRTMNVRLATLDGIMPHDDVDLVKIDVEGAELGVLRGAEALTAASRPLYMFESGPDEMQGFTHAALWQWFEERDYDLLLPNRVAHLAPGMALDVFLDSHIYPRRTINYFGVPRERRADVRARARRVLRLD